MAVDGSTSIKLPSGISMPIIGLGTWELKNDTAGAIRAALSIGYRMIDTSGDYGTQPGIGEGLRASGLPRNSYYIITKIEEDDDAYKAVKHNLNELGLSYADLILIHRPPKQGVGEDLWRGLQQAREEGLVTDLGVSNYSVPQLRELTETTGEIPLVNQIEWTPFGHSEEMYAFCADNDIILQAYSPLTRGERLDDELVADIARSYGKTSAQLLIRWNLQLSIIPIVKANQIHHMEENIDIFDFIISEDDMATLNGLNEHYSALGRQPMYLINS